MYPSHILAGLFLSVMLSRRLAKGKPRSKMPSNPAAPFCQPLVGLPYRVSKAAGAAPRKTSGFAAEQSGQRQRAAPGSGPDLWLGRDWGACPHVIGQPGQEAGLPDGR